MGKNIRFCCLSALTGTSVIMLLDILLKYPVIDPHLNNETGPRVRKRNSISRGSKRAGSGFSFNDMLPRSETWHDARDRTQKQLRYIPTNYRRGAATRKLIYVDMPLWFIEQYQEWINTDYDVFGQNCDVVDCDVITSNSSALIQADAFMFQFNPSKENVMIKIYNNTKQVWILYNLESPVVSHVYEGTEGLVNWTVSYRSISTIPEFYFTMLVPVTHGEDRLHKSTKTLTRYRTKKIAWVVSNWNPDNDRSIYANELSKFIQVDIYGHGHQRCSPGDSCFEELGRKYKFYLSFENANCREYITEKLYNNALRHNMVPIVLGAAREDYEHVAPPYSFIYAHDFASPEQLADYLKLLDADDALYNTYMAWKTSWKLVDVGDKLMCRLCAMLHGADEEGAERRWYKDVGEWVHYHQEQFQCD